jgi:hypothetical protein
VVIVPCDQFMLNLSGTCTNHHDKLGQVQKNWMLFPGRHGPSIDEAAITVKLAY